jgi:hypothetical protein
VLLIHCGLEARSVHRGPEWRWWPKLIGARAHRRSRARDLAVVARGAREGDRNPYPGWHEVAEGLEWLGVGVGRQWWSELDEMVLRAQR